MLTAHHLVTNVSHWTSKFMLHFKMCVDFMVLHLAFGHNYYQSGIYSCSTALKYRTLIVAMVSCALRSITVNN